MREVFKQGTGKKLLLITFIGIVAVLLFGYTLYAGGRSAMLSQINSSNLALTHTYKSYVELNSKQIHADDVLMHLHDLWRRAGSPYHGAYLSVLDEQGRAIMDTRGQNADSSQFNGSVDRSENPARLAELFANRQDYSGTYRSRSGQQQLAAFSYVPSLDALVSIHVPSDSVQTQWRQVVMPWLVGLAVLVSIIMSILIFIYRHRPSGSGGVKMTAQHFNIGADQDSVSDLAMAEKKINELQSRYKDLEHSFQIERDREKANRLQLLDKVEELEKLNHRKTEFLSRLNHELCTPLHAILGFAQLLRQTRLNKDQQENLEDLYAAALYQQQLIADILQLSIIESGRLEMIIAPVDIHKLSDECIRLIKPSANAKNISLHFNYDKGEPLMVDADSLHLKQVISNLLSNAIKFNKAGGDVYIETHHADGLMSFQVRDTGVGLAEEQLDQLFIPFTDMHLSGYKNQGAGIGLSICHMLIERMQGQIHVSSRQGVGTEFKIELPMSVLQTDTIGVRMVSSLETSANKQRCTLLYVDNNMMNQDLVRRLVISRPDLDFIGTTDTGQCLSLIRSYSPDIVMLGSSMQKKSVDEMIAQLKSDPSASLVPVISLHAGQDTQTKSHVAAGFRAARDGSCDAEVFYQAVCDALPKMQGGSGKS